MPLLEKLFSASITFREVPTEKLGELGRSVMEMLGVAPYFPIPLYVLHTCNRVEVYAWDVPQPIVHAVLSRYGGYADRVVVRRGTEAALHLLEVAAGLDSMLIGETDILGQMEEAFDSQVKSHVTRDLLKVVVERAIRFGKMVRTNTNISRGPRGLGSLSIIYVKETMGDLSNLSIGIIGAGSVGQGLAKELKDEGARRIYILNRTFEKAKEIAERIGATAMPLNRESIDECLKKCDVVFATATSFEPIIKEVPPNHKVRLIVDLGVPMNVSNNLPVKVVRLDDLKPIADRYNSERLQEIQKVKAMALEEVENIERALARRAVEIELGEYMRLVALISQEEGRRAGANASLAASSAAKRAVLPLIEALKKHAESGNIETVMQILNDAKRLMKIPQASTS